MTSEKFFKYLFLGLIVLIISCRNDTLQSVSKPGNLLSREKMALILSDIHLAEAGLAELRPRVDSLKRLNAGYQEFILKKHQVDQDQFENSFNYYLSIPMQMDTVYMFVIDELNKRESKSKGILVDTTTKYSSPL